MSNNTRFITPSKINMMKHQQPLKHTCLQSYNKHTLYDIFEEQDEETEEEEDNDYVMNSSQHYFANKRHSTGSSYSLIDHLETIYEVEEEQQ